MAKKDKPWRVSTYSLSGLKQKFFRGSAAAYGEVFRVKEDIAAYKGLFPVTRVVVHHWDHVSNKWGLYENTYPE
jgi:hypothetical protein